MNLLFLHGRPATGKYTIGRELAAQTGYELYHNHLVVDEVLKVHAFGSPGFIAERDRRWRAYFLRTAAAQLRGLIFTFSPENSVPQAFIDWLFDGLPAAGAVVLSVELLASEPAIEDRLASKQRRGFRKLADLELYRRLRASGSFDTPVIPRTELRIDTERHLPAGAAREIASHFGLRPVPNTA
jgi:hypothetical protein